MKIAVVGIGFRLANVISSFPPTNKLAETRQRSDDVLGTSRRVQ